jgi:2'-5' RNA ligase
MKNEPLKINAPQVKRKERDLSNTMPGYKINEYLLVLNPHEALRDKIMETRKYVYDTYKNSAAVYSKPHITLVSFVQYQMMEEKLINRFQVIAMGCPPVKIELKDYGSFPSHTIYINVTSKLPVEHLVKSIRTEAQRLMKLNSDNKPHFILHPYVTIARKLEPWQFEKAWAEFRALNFTGRFIADAMLLLKRPVGELNYTIVQRFDFKNLPVSTVQGDLFG